MESIVFDTSVSTEEDHCMFRTKPGKFAMRGRGRGRAGIWAREGPVREEDLERNHVESTVQSDS